MQMSSYDVVYDNHTIYLYTGNIPDENIILHINKMHEKAVCYVKSIDNSFNGCKFYYNMIRGRDGDTLGKCILWIEDPRVFYILIGLNIDGSEVENRLLSHDIINLGKNGNWNINYVRYEGKLPSAKYNPYKIICERLDGDEISPHMYIEIKKFMSRYKSSKIYVDRVRKFKNKVTVNFCDYYAIFPLAMVKFFEIEGVTFKCSYARDGRDAHLRSTTSR